MTEILAYGLLALAMLVVAAWLVRNISSRAPTGPPVDDGSSRGILEGWGLNLGERIFDPEDFHWLREELSFPPAAEALARHRKQLALEWLKALQHSFKELVRTPESERPGSKEGEAGGWQVLWLTLRFHLLLSYTLIVVRFFGPYHLLIPSFGWASSLRRLIAQRHFGKTAVPGRIR